VEGESGPATHEIEEPQRQSFGAGLNRIHSLLSGRATQSREARTRCSRGPAFGCGRKLGPPKAVSVSLRGDQAGARAPGIRYAVAGRSPALPALGGPYRGPGHVSGVVEQMVDGGPIGDEKLAEADGEQEN
jgi:hypothetical protein